MLRISSFNSSLAKWERSGGHVMVMFNVNMVVFNVTEPQTPPQTLHTNARGL